MSLLLDDREPDDLRRNLSAYDLTTTVTRLDFGDAMFEGLDWNGPCTVAIERKRITDLIDCLKTRRLGGFQLPGMLKLYDHSYLLVEGLYHPNQFGQIEIKKGSHWLPERGITYRQVDSFLDSISVAGIGIIRSESLYETAAIYASRYLHWQKPWKDRNSLQQIYSNILAPPHSKASFRPREPGPVELVAAQMPGIDSKAWIVGEHFPDVLSMVCAPESQWLKIKGIGKDTAAKVRRWLGHTLE